MARIIKSHLGNFLVILILGSVFITGFLFLKSLLVEAQEQIKIFPTSFTSDWQNPEAVFPQDLSENATFEEFNTENSAYPLEILEIPSEEITEEEAEESIEEPAEQEQQEEEPEATSFWNKVGIFFKGIVWAQEENQEEVPSNEEELLEEELFEEESPVEEPVEEAIPEEEPTEEVEGDEEIPGEELLEEPVEEEQITLVEKILELSNFAVSGEFEETKINNIQLRLSLAGKGGTGDRLIISYYYQDLWQSLASFDLENEISNAINNGYFLYALPIFENWEELDNLKIKFTYVGEADSQSLVYLDAVWLEVEYGEKELIEEEEILEESEEYILELTSGKDDFELNEEPAFNFRYQKKRSFVEAIGAGILNLFRDEYKDINIKATVLGLNVSPSVSYLESGEFLVELEKPRQFRPGKYRLKIEIEDNGQVFTQEQDFTWGVLAINTNKSIYLANEIAYLQMAALQDDGHTICDANLSLTITTPKSEIANPSVQRSGECGPDNVTDKPDYFAYYQTGGVGTYQMKLTNLDNGFEITDSFEVREAVPFEIERQGPTRIYPPADYEMRLIIKVNQDFVGEVIETVPADFEIQSSGFRLQVLENEKQIVWWVDWKVGETYELRYTFDAPDISPYLYLLGPLKIGDFQEIRQWQIAADEIAKAGTDANGSSSATPLQFNHTLVAGSDRLVVILIGWENQGSLSVTGVTYGGETCTEATQDDDGATYWNGTAIYYISEADLPSDGVNQVSITMSGASTLDLKGYVAQYTGVTAGGPDSADSTAEGASTPPDSTIENTGLTAVSGDLCVSAADSGNTGSWAHGQSQNELWDFQDASSQFAATDLIATGSVSTLESTFTGTLNRLARSAACWSAAPTNVAPNTPTLSETPAFANMLTNDTTPVLGNFSATDDDSDVLEYDIQWDEDFNFGTPVTNNSADYETNGFTAATFASGADVSYTVQAGEALTNGQTYWWRVRARDPAGSNTWTSYSAKRSITIDTSLTVDRWFQTTTEQFDTDTLTDAEAAAGSVKVGGW